MKKIMWGCLTLFIIIIVGGMMSFFATKKILQNSDPPPVSNQAEDTIKKDDASSSVSLEIYQPTKFDTKNDAPYYIIIKNNGNKPFKGTFEVSGIETLRETDKVGALSLNPHEAKIIPGKGTIPNADQVKLSVKGDAAGAAYHIDPSLKYTIVGQEGNDPDSHPNGIFLYVYVEPNEQDDKYIAISKEIQSNYDRNAIVADFSPIMIKPDNHDARVVFASNKTLKFSHVLFYDDVTNTNASDNERKKVNI